MDIFVAIPAYTGDVCAQTMHSLLHSIEEGRKRDQHIRVENVHCRLQDADIAQARNAFLGAFLKTQCTHLWFVDSDVSWGPDAFESLFSHEADFVAGAYRSKIEEEKYPILWSKPGAVVADTKSGKPLVSVDGVPAGFCRMTRKGVEKIAAAAEKHFHDKVAEAKCPWIFEFSWHNGERMSEDFTFCRRWREVVGPVYLDPACCVDHTGKKTYCGNIYANIEKLVKEAA